MDYYIDEVEEHLPQTKIYCIIVTQIEFYKKKGISFVQNVMKLVDISIKKVLFPIFG